MKTIFPNDDKTKNAFVKQERGGRPSLFGAIPCKEEEGESQLTNEARAETEPVLWLCLARRKKAEGQDKTHTISKT